MRTRSWSVALALLCCSAPAAAQTVLSEADALKRLAPNSALVRALRAGADIARADALSAGRWPNPRFTYNRESVAGVTENMFLVTQSLPITGRRGLDVDAATALVGAASSRVDDELRRARAELRGAYAELVSAQEREREISRVLDSLREIARVLERRESAGDAAGYDRLRAEREVTDVENDLSSARAERVRAQAGVAAFFAEGTDPLTIVAVAPAAPRSSLPAVEELVARARMVRGEATALRREVESAQFAERAASRRLVPEPEVVAGTKSSNVLGGDVGSVLSVHASIPLFDRAQPEHALARARLAQAESRAALFDQTLRAQIAGLRALVIERREAADRFRAAAARTGELERIAEVSYEAGERGILELLDAYRSGAAARTRQVQLDAAVRQAEIELEFVSGWEMQR